MRILLTDLCSTPDTGTSPVEVQHYKEEQSTVELIHVYEATMLKVPLDTIVTMVSDYLCHRYSLDWHAAAVSS